MILKIVVSNDNCSRFYFNEGILIMDKKEFYNILKNIYASLNYEDWFHAREYVKIEMEKLEKEIKKKS